MEELTEVIINELIHQETVLKKYTTNIENLFVYKVQKGWGWIPLILKKQNDENDEWYNEQSIIIEYCNVIDGEFTEQETIHYNGLEEQYEIIQQ